jgi:hypothetical protein
MIMRGVLYWFNSPRHFLCRVLALVFVVSVFSSGCTTTAKDGESLPDISPAIPEPALAEGTIRFNNKTPFTVRLVRGSGRIDVLTLSPHDSEAIPNHFSQTEQYYPLFDIPLTEEYVLSGIRPLNPDFYYQSDNSTGDQEIHIILPPALNDDSVYLVFTNKGGAGGVSLSRNNSSSLMTCVNFPGAKSNVNSGETFVYRENPGGISGLRLRPAGIAFGQIKYRSGFVYSFTFDGTAVTLTDARPLQSIGEPSWAKTLTGVSTPAVLAAEGEGIIVTPSGDYETASAYALADGSLLTAGFTNRNGLYSPLARKEGPDGVTRWELPPSRRADSRLAYYLALTRGSGDLWLAAGGADTGINEAAGFKAYIRCFRDQGAAADTQWELGPDDFTERCGAVKSAAWAGNRFLVTGDFLNPEGTAAYTASIDGGGNINNIDAGFAGFSCSKILAAPDGAYYLIGEEQKADGLSYAVVLKYSAQGQRLWRTTEQPGPFSYYQDAVLDEEGDLIVLAGAMNAADQYGGEGTPFMEGINAGTGKQEWLTPLNHPAFAGTSLASGLVKAPGYGYIVSLAGIAAANYRPPFMIARVNARGRLSN